MTKTPKRKKTQAPHRESDLPVTLAPLSPKEALGALLAVKPDVEPETDESQDEPTSDHLA